MLSVKALTLENIGRIANLTLEFSEGVNLLCGPNGVGKTTILDCIGQAFSHVYDSVLRRRVGTEGGSYRLEAKAGEGRLVLENIVKPFEPVHREWTQGAGDWEKQLISLKTNRAFNYLKIDALKRDPGDTNRHRTLGATGIEFEDIKNWFVNRYLFSEHAGALTDEQLQNFELAKRAFSALDPTVSFSKITATTFDIMVRTPDGEIYFEYLSSGFKSCLCLTIGLIKEIEYRFTNPFIHAKEFDGVVLIDELDLHLHPEWQPRLISMMKETFPKCQLIGATHSPHMVQSAARDEVIALEANNEGKVVRRILPSGGTAFQGWTVEEILTDVMGMPDTRSRRYRELEAEFEAAIDRGDHGTANRVFGVLEEFLHPNNVQRKLFKLQLGRLEAQES